MNDEFTAFLGEPVVPIGITLLLGGITYPDPGYRIDRWRSCGYYILEYIVEGRGILECENETFYPAAGDAYLLLPEVRCGYHSDRKNPWKKIWFNMTGPLCEALVNACQLKDNIFYPQVHLENEFRNALQIVTDGKSDAYHHFALAIADLLLKLQECYLKRQAPPAAQSKEARLLKEYLSGSFAQKLNQRQLCALVKKSPAQVRRIFRDAWGVSPRDYVQKLRLKTAIQYLENTNFTIRNIADRLGFQDEYYFANWFKAKTGSAPKSYLKMPHNEEDSRLKLPSWL